MSSAPASILGLDVGGTKTAVVAGTIAGQVIDKVVLPSRAERGFDHFFADICRHVETALSRRPEVRAIGVSIGGPVDPTAGLVLGPPNLPGWDRVPLRDLLQQRFDRPVFVEHDAKMGAVAEWRFGAGRGAQDLVFLTAGTGLGAGLILGGRLHRGACDAGGEVGHWRIADDGPGLYGKRGSWEGLSSGAGLAALARERLPQTFGPEASAQSVLESAERGDAGARAVLAESAQALGRGLALLVDLLAPEVIVLGGLARRLGEMWLAPA